jgi:NAD-dependent DNA ligase
MEGYFFLVGEFGESQKELDSLITKSGGIVQDSISKKTTHIVAATEEVSKKQHK